VNEAAELISMLEDLRPTEGAQFNAFAEMWKRIAHVPPAAKARLLEEITPGVCACVCVCARPHVCMSKKALLLFVEAHCVVAPGGQGCWRTPPVCV